MTFKVSLLPIIWPSLAQSGPIWPFCPKSVHQWALRSVYNIDLAILAFLTFLAFWPFLTSKTFFAFLTFSIFGLFGWEVLTNEPYNLFPFSKSVDIYQSIFKANLGDILLKIMSKKVVKGKVWQGNDF